MKNSINFNLLNNRTWQAATNDTHALSLVISKRPSQLLGYFYELIGTEACRARLFSKRVLT